MLLLFSFHFSTWFNFLSVVHYCAHKYSSWLFSIPVFTNHNRGLGGGTSIFNVVFLTQISVLIFLISIPFRVRLWIQLNTDFFSVSRRKLTYVWPSQSLRNKLRLSNCCWKALKHHRRVESFFFCFPGSAVFLFFLRCWSRLRTAVQGMGVRDRNHNINAPVQWREFRIFLSINQ